MSTFAELVARNGNVGLAYTLVAYADRADPPLGRYSTNAIPGSTVWDPRLVSVGRLQRGLVPEFAIASSTVQVVLDNTDGLVDYLVDQAHAETEMLRSSFDLAVVAYALDNPADLQSFSLGRFVLLNRPSAGMGAITLSLADDSLGRAAELASAPSLLDWVNDAGTDSTNCPLVVDTDPALGFGFNILNAPLVDVSSIDAPIRLAFGHQPIKAVRCLEAAAAIANAGSTIFVGNASGSGTVFNNQATSNGVPIPASQIYGTGYLTTPANRNKRVLMVCATTNSGVNPTGTKVYLGFDSPYKDGSMSLVSVPPTTNLGSHPGTIWTANVSQTLTKDGRDWKLVYIIVDYDKLGSWWNATINVGSVNWPTPTYLESNWYAHVPLFSGHTFTIPAIGQPIAQTAAQIALDLLAFYSRGLDSGAGDIDVSSFMAASDAQLATPAWGTIDDDRYLNDFWSTGLQGKVRVEGVGGRMRAALQDICRSAQFDITTKWDGTFLAIPQTAYIDLADPDVTAASLVDLDELLMSADSWTEKFPSEGERWAPHNRLYITNRADQTLGPFDSGNYWEGGFDADRWGIILPYTLISKWVDYPETMGGNFWALTGFEAKARPVVKARFSMASIALVEIGQYVLVSWRRGGSLSARYDKAVFKIEALTLMPESAELELQLVWYGDLQTDLPYILDDETLTLVVAASGGRTATVTDGDNTVQFSSGDLLADGVLAGDILILKDTLLLGENFSRYRALRISQANDTAELVIDNADLNFHAPSGVAVGDWEIHRGFTTYPNTVSDPTHYPRGSLFYGKATDAAGVFSDDTPGNKLLSG